MRSRQGRPPADFALFNYITSLSQESQKEFIAHSVVSRNFAEDPLVLAGLEYMSDEVWQVFAHVGNHDKSLTSRS